MKYVKNSGKVGWYPNEPL